MLNQNNVITNPIDQVKGLSDRETYGFVNTSEVLNVFGQAGWAPVSENVGRVRSIERQGFQKHLIRLENPAYQSIEGLTNSNKSRPQLVLLNSHDGTTSLQILWGLIRVACLNGIIAGTGLNGVRLVHSRSIVDKLPQGIDYMLNNFDNFANQIKALQGKVLSQAAQAELIKRVYDARLQSVHNVTSIDYSLSRLQRHADDASDAYTIFNRVQETLMRGGIRYQHEKHEKNVEGVTVSSRTVSATTRKIASVTSQVKLNQLAYDSALELVA